MSAAMSVLTGFSVAATMSAGKGVFIAAMLLLLAWLVYMPRRFIGQTEHVPVWWRNVRVWAIVVNVLQICIYLFA
jgi:hypothetical protein